MDQHFHGAREALRPYFIIDYTIAASNLAFTNPCRPYNIQTLQFSVPNVKNLRYLARVIGRLKQGE